MITTQSDCLNQAWENYQSDPNDTNKSEVDYWISQTTVIGKDEIRTKLHTAIELLEASQNGFAMIVRNKLSNLLKNI